MNKQQKHIEAIREEFNASQRVMKSLRNATQTLAEDLYSKETHFIFELIQNAEDNEYGESEKPSLCFSLTKSNLTNTSKVTGALVIQNNEVGFHEGNVDAICKVGETTKSKIKGYIGEKGIGFKSVYRITSTPHIFSNGYQFRLPEKDEETGLGYIVPQWVDQVPSKIDPTQTTIILPLDKPDFCYDKVLKMIEDIVPETILFLSKLREVKIAIENGNNLSILKDDQNEPRIELLVEDKKRGMDSDPKEYLLYSDKVAKPESIRQKNRDTIKEREISIAFPVTPKHDQNLEYNIFAYLPVCLYTKLHFLVNSDFILPSSREDIRDVPWNKWLMDCVGNLFVESLSDLKARKVLQVPFLESLIKGIDEINEGDIYYSISKKAKEAFLNKELLPASDGTFISARKAKIARGADLINLLDQEQCNLFFQADANDNIKYLEKEITQDRTPCLRSYLLRELEVEEVTPESFVERLSKNFLVQQSDEWFIKFYGFLSERPGLKQHLKTKPIIRLQDNTHVIPFKDNGQPNAFLPPEGDTDFPTVKREIFNDQQSKKFLSDLGIGKIGKKEEIEVMLKRNYMKENHKQKINDIKRFIDFLENNPSEKGLFGDYFIFKLANGKWAKPQSVYLDSPFLETGLSAYFELEENSQKSPWALSLDKNCEIDLKEIATFAEKVGARVKLEPKRQEIPWNHPEIDKLEKKIDDRESRYKIDEDYNLQEFDKLLRDPNLKKSRLVWDTMVGLANHDEYLRAVYCRNKSHNCQYGKSTLVHKLKDGEWVPQRQDDGEHSFVKPADAVVKLLPAGFSFEIGIGAKWLESVEFGKRERLEKEKNSAEFQRDEEAAQRFGFSSELSPDEIKKLAQISKENLDELKKFLERLNENRTPDFPPRENKNPERRKQRLKERRSKAPKKVREKKERTVRTTQDKEQAKKYLENLYTDKSGKLICQLCKETMPFKKKDGKYYFETVELLDLEEDDQNYLALCPTCAAKFNEYVVGTEQRDALPEKLASLNDPEPPLDLVELPLELDSDSGKKPSIMFRKVHLDDIKTILEPEKE